MSWRLPSCHYGLATSGMAPREVSLHSDPASTASTRFTFRSASESATAMHPGIAEISARPKHMAASLPAVSLIKHLTSVSWFASPHA